MWKTFLDKVVDQIIPDEEKNNPVGPEEAKI